MEMVRRTLDTAILRVVGHLATRHTWAHMREDLTALCQLTQHDPDWVMRVTDRAVAQRQRALAPHGDQRIAEDILPCIEVRCMGAWDDMCWLEATPCQQGYVSCLYEWHYCCHLVVRWMLGLVTAWDIEATCQGGEDRDHSSHSSARHDETIREYLDGLKKAVLPDTIIV